MPSVTCNRARAILTVAVAVTVNLSACSSDDTAVTDSKDVGDAASAGKRSPLPDAGTKHDDAGEPPSMVVDAGSVCTRTATGCGPIDSGLGPIRDDGGKSPTFARDGGSITVADGGTNVCEQIGSACAKVDPGTGPVHDCAVLQASTDLAACTTAFDGCQSLCGKSICVRLGSICHDVDPGSGPIHDCHFGGHAGVASWCFDNAVHCYAICAAAMEQQP